MPKQLGVKIAGTGRALPDKVLNNQFFVDHLDTTDEWIRERTGIQERRVVVEGETTASLATTAARAALADAKMTPQDLDMIIVSTITPECPFPSTACFVQQALKAAPIPAMDLAAACSGFIYGLVNASFLLQGGHYKNILVIGAETMSKITDYEDRSTCILFGDGAGAAILSATQPGDSECILHYKLHAEGSGLTMLCVPAGGSRVPASRMTVDERLHYVKMQGREVYKLAVKRNLELVDSTLSEAGIRAEDISLVIPHQSNLRIIESARQRLGLAPERIFTNIQRYGNTSAASIPIALDECRKTGRVKPGDLILLIGFGAGLTWGSALMRI
jgi:3-oxoacyl-[acyl-carrier-protein] synthase-3